MDDKWGQLEIWLINEITETRESAKRCFESNNQTGYEKLLQQDIALTRVTRKMNEIEFKK